MIIISLSLRNIVQLYISTENRKNNLLANEILFVVCNEIKYNIEYDHIKDVLGKANLVLKYDNNFLKQIQYESLLLMENNAESNSNNICISLEEEINGKLKIRITISNKDNDPLDRVICKAEWMDEK
ncbi:MAG: hypothetical protein GX275_11190 [Clostridiales bacterium]|nr:hypothetical protein [Clostridiales bacterium]